MDKISTSINTVNKDEEKLLIETAIAVIRFGSFKPYIEDLAQFFEVINEVQKQPH